MTTTTQKRKLSKSAWFLVFLLIAVVITVTVLAAIGYISLAFLGDILVGYMTFGASSWVTATIAITIPFLVGILFYWTIKTYFIGNKTQGVIQQPGGYAPTPTYPSATQKDTETVIS
jgi:hypothetical protein